MAIKYIEHVNGTASPDKVAVEYAIRDSAGNVIKDTYLKTAGLGAALAGLSVWSAAPSDTTYFIRQDTAGTATFGKVPFSTVWTYISGKMTKENASTTQIYLDGWNTSSSKFQYDSNVYLSTTAGELVATRFNVSAAAHMSYDSTEDAIKFTFV